MFMCKIYVATYNVAYLQWLRTLTLPPANQLLK